MKAMILAAGLGTRMRPLTLLRAKPALPIRGRPVISLLLEFLAQHGISEVMINLHYLPSSIRDAVERDRPRGLTITWSEEAEPLGTGGGIRKAQSFLAGDRDCVVLAGDMLLDLDLTALLERHRASRRDVSLILRTDDRGVAFGTIGVDAQGRLQRIGKRILGDAETRSGLFTGVRIFSPRALGDWPEGLVFEDLRDWLAPLALAGKRRVGAEFVGPRDSVWEPVGTPAEYLAVNLNPPRLPSLGGEAEIWQGKVEVRGSAADVILGEGCSVDPGAKLMRCVVWDREVVPGGFEGADGVFAAGEFHSCSVPH